MRSDVLAIAGWWPELVKSAERPVGAGFKPPPLPGAYTTVYGRGRRRDLTGQRFGHLVVREYDERASRWLCDCDCGGTALVQPSRLLRGERTACGCRRRAA